MGGTEEDGRVQGLGDGTGGWCSLSTRRAKPGKVRNGGSWICPFFCFVFFF